MNKNINDLISLIFDLLHFSTQTEKYKYQEKLLNYFFSENPEKIEEIKNIILTPNSLLTLSGLNKLLWNINNQTMVDFFVKQKLNNLDEVFV